MNIYSSLGIDFKITEEDIKGKEAVALTKELFDAAYQHYVTKNEGMLEKAMPVLRNVHAQRGATVKEIMVPITDSLKQIGVVINLDSTIQNEGRDLIRAIEKNVTLAIIDQNWKEHLRDMDDLKQSVQNAVYEQKDPLLIYKFEAFEMFKRFIGKLNEDVISFLAKSELPRQDPDQVRAAQAQRTQEPKVQASKEDAGSTLGGGNRTAVAPRRPAPQVVAPRKSDKVYGRNDKVSVRYTDGKVLKDVKFKSVEQDVASSKCIVIED